MRFLLLIALLLQIQSPANLRLVDPMALVETKKLSDANYSWDSANAWSATSFNTDSNSLLVVVAVASIGDAVNPSSEITISSNPVLTWTPRVSIGSAISWGCGHTVFTAPVTTGAATVITLDCGARSIAAYMIQVISYTGYNTSSPVGATVTKYPCATDGAESLTLSGTPASDSYIVGFLEKDMDSGVATSTPGTDWAELYDQGISNNHYLHSQSITGSISTSVPWIDVNDAAGTVAKAMASAIEIKVAAGGPSSTPESEKSLASERSNQLIMSSHRAVSIISY